MNMAKGKSKIVALITVLTLIFSQLAFSENVFASVKEDKAEPQYIGVNAGSEVPESFTNDLWLQYDFKEMDIGDKAELNPRRVEEAITDGINNNVGLPHFNYEIIKGDSVEIDDKVNAHAVVNAVKKGVSVVKVTYDGMTHKGGKYFAATDPVNTAYVIYSVAGDKNIEIKDNIVYEKPKTGEILFRSYDTVYFSEGKTVNFPLKVTQKGADKLEVFCNGLPVKGEDGNYILPLENRSNIIEMRGTAENGAERSFFRVIDARKIEIKKENLTHPGESFSKGDKVKVSFRGITMPVYKLASIYNPGMGSGAARVCYRDNHGQSYEGICNQYDLATKNSFEVELKEKGTYKFTGGEIYSKWWGDELGSDKIKDSQGQPNLNAEEYESYFSIMPDFEIRESKDLEKGSARINNKGFTKVKSGYKVTATGKQIKPVPVVKDDDGRILEEGKDFKLSYSKDKITKPGKYFVTVTGTGDYTGKLKINFFVTPKAPSKAGARLSKSKGGYDDVVFSWSKSEGASGYYVNYRKSGSRNWSKSYRTTKTSFVKKNLTDGCTYEFKVTPYYKSGDIRYKSTKYRTAKVTTLKKVNLKSVKKYKSSKVKVRWENIAGETGYQISKSTKKNGTHIVYTCKTTKGTNKVLKVKKNKGYYYKVRAYKTIDGKKIYAPWSKVKYCRVK